VIECHHSRKNAGFVNTGIMMIASLERSVNQKRIYF
jgi:hypothetical protein